MPPHDTSRHGEITWNELYARDARAALPFYGELFGWILLEEMDMGAAGPYFIYGQDGQQYGGIMTADLPPSAALYFGLTSTYRLNMASTRLGRN